VRLEAEDLLRWFPARRPRAGRHLVAAAQVYPPATRQHQQVVEGRGRYDRREALAPRCPPGARPAERVLRQGLDPPALADDKQDRSLLDQAGDLRDLGRRLAVDPGTAVVAVLLGDRSQFLLEQRYLLRLAGQQRLQVLDPLGEFL